MKLSFSYGTGVRVLPADVLLHLDKATKKDIRILFELAASTAPTDLAAATEKLTACGFSTEEINAAIAFWRGTGVLCMSEDDEKPIAPAPATTPVATAQTATLPAPRVFVQKGLPSYASDELSDILERRQWLKDLLPACQETFGKVFNTAESAIIVGMADHLGLDAEYILLLLSHCRRMDKKSLRYVEKMALSLYDEGICEADALEKKLKRIEDFANTAGRVRAIFGMDSRALTAKEKLLIETWVSTMKYSDEVIRRAYEITVDTIGKASLSYAGKILERWHAEGLVTLEDVDTAIAEYKRKKAADGSSFDVDDFFNAALERTYGGDK